MLVFSPRVITHHLATCVRVYIHNSPTVLLNVANDIMRTTIARLLPLLHLPREISVKALSVPCCARWISSDSSQKTHFGFQTVTEEEKAEKVKQVFSNVASKYDLMN